MLELLCQIRYRRLFFVLISVPSVCWFWYNIYEHDVANAVNGVVTIDVAGYFCSLVLIVLLTFLILGIMNLFFDLDFECKTDKFQDFFISKLREKQQNERNKAYEAAERTRQKQQLEMKEKQELESFVRYCKIRGGRYES